MSPRIYLVSCAGHPNYGDELIAASWLRLLAEVVPDAEVWLDCPNPGLAAELFFGLHPRLHFTNTLWRLVWDWQDVKGEAGVDGVTPIVRDLGSPTYDLGVLRLREIDRFHVLGGGYLNSLWPSHWRLLDALVAVREITGATLNATGLSLAPLDPDHYSYLRVLQSFDHVSVRDQYSADLLEVDLGLDDALLGVLMERERGEDRATDGDVIVCLQRDLVSDSEFSAMVQKVRSAILGFQAAGNNVMYVEGIPGVDHAGYEALSDLIPPENFVPFLSVWRDGLPHGAHTWITTRFHLHLVAASMGASGIAIGVRPGYYDVKHRSLLELGTGWTYVGVGEDLGGASADPSFPRTVEEYARSKKDEGATLYGRSDDAESTAKGTPVSPARENAPLSRIRRAMRGNGRTIADSF